MTPDEARAVLGVGPDASAQDIRQAYLTRLRDHPPEEDQEGFMRVRAAFECLRKARPVRLAPRPAPPPPEPSAPAPSVRPRLPVVIDPARQLRNAELAMGDEPERAVEMALDVLQRVGPSALDHLARFVRIRLMTVGRVPADRTAALSEGVEALGPFTVRELAGFAALEHRFVVDLEQLAPDMPVALVDALRDAWMTGDDALVYERLVDEARRDAAPYIAASRRVRETNGPIRRIFSSRILALAHARSNRDNNAYGMVLGAMLLIGTAVLCAGIAVFDTERPRMPAPFDPANDPCSTGFSRDRAECYARHAAGDLTRACEGRTGDDATACTRMVNALLDGENCGWLDQLASTAEVDPETHADLRAAYRVACVW